MTRVVEDTRVRPLQVICKTGNRVYKQADIEISLKIHFKTQEDQDLSNDLGVVDWIFFDVSGAS